MNSVFFLTPVGYAEVKNIFTSLEDISSSGCDNYSNNLEKAIAPATIAFLADFINLYYSFLKKGVFPISLKCAKVILLHRNGSKDCVSNYRPLHRLAEWSTVSEPSMYTTSYGFFERFLMFWTKQFSFGKKHRRFDALAEFRQKIAINLPSDHYVFFKDL